jgi:hypothetical protein
MACPIGFCLIRQPSAIPIVSFSPNRFARRLDYKGQVTNCERPKHKSNDKKAIMDTQQDPNQPNKPTSPGQGRQQDREKEERERQRREQEKQGGGKQGGGQQGGR